MTEKKTRVHNFGAGPAVLPETVLEQARDELLAYGRTGMSVLEMSHRSAAFGEIITGAEADLRRLAGLSDDYAVMFIQGGASMQFAMVPMNLRGEGRSADYVLSGIWSKKALKEAQTLGAARVAGTTEGERFVRVPGKAEIDFDQQAAYLHFTSNNTIYGTQWRSEPEPPAGVPLICDASSDILSRPLDVAKYGLIYAGAQKNLGPAGVVVVVMRRDLLERTPAKLPLMLSYKQMAESRSLYNTPPTFAVYVIGLVLKWLLALGGLAEIARRNEEKAKRLYDAIDGSGGFYRGHALPEHRSLMNVTFRIASEDLEKEFVKNAEAAGLSGLKGHRSVGGLRASIYNALPPAAIDDLVAFMADFQRRKG
ncbi:MAG: 3-phosphoserine/phosphohydroxythreonine transaminase [Vicinamibacteria bacterium]|nr:3-phosphoserine/phosphohydroxythreonine transaminase [Vicinamibacteria bacterium]